MNAEAVQTNPHDAPYIPPSRWPTSFGVVAIVFGCFAFLGGIGGIVQSVFYGKGFMKGFMKASAGASSASKDAEEMMDGMFGAFEEMSLQMTISHSVLMVLGIMLAVGGILLLMRRRVASMTIQVWAVLKIIAGGFATYLNWQLMTRMMSGTFEKLAASSPSAGAVSPMETMGIMYKVIYAFQFLWLAALPIVFLIWLNRAPIRADLKEGAWK